VDIAYPLEAQVYLTRECNLRCEYCILTKKQLKELSLDEWKSVFSVLDSIGIKSVKLLGGEPTVKGWLEELIAFITNNTSIRCVLLSNSHFDEDRMNSLVAAGLWGYFASVDSILAQPITPGSSHTDIKAMDGYYMLHKFKEAGVQFLGANVVISSENILEIPETVKKLSDEGFWVNLCPIIWGIRNSETSFEYRAPDSQLKLTSEYVPKLREMALELLRMKRNGAKIIASESYIQGIPIFGVRQHWHCSRLSQLRVDADGSIMCCPDIRGIASKKYTVWSLKDLQKYRQLVTTDWLKDSKQCPGCYWSSIFLAEENLLKGRPDFWYLNS